MVKKGSRGKEVKNLQEFLGLEADGIFGQLTEATLRAYQMNNGLIPDGVAGRKTFEIMGILDTDQSEQQYTTENGLIIHRHFLPEGEYIEGPIKNDYMFLHHTAGWHNPFKVIDSWGRDDRGRIATEFVLGGQKITDNKADHDGVMVQAFPEGGQGWHLGKTGSSHMARHSVGLEICSFGYLKEGKTYVGTKAHESQVSQLNAAFKGYDQWHKYSDAQLEATRKWIIYIAERDGIDLAIGLIPWIKEKGVKAFDFNEDAYKGKVKGLLTHTNVRKDKFDSFPQPELLDMLLSI